MSKFFFSFSIILTSLCCSFGVVAQQNATIKGHVTTSDNKPADFVSVMLSNNQGTSTNANGDFVFHKLKAGNYTIKVSAVGLSAQTKEISLNAAQTTIIDFMLNENAEQLKEVNINASKTNKFIIKQSETVGKMPLTQLENPQVYTTVGKELLTEQLVFSVDDAVRNVPGLQTMWQATGRSGDGGSYYNLRGFNVQSNLRNGLTGIVSGTTDAANLEKLEVVKGPSATLFGSAFTTYGGLLNRITKKPYDTFGGEIANAIGSYGFNRLSVDVNTPVDAAKKVLFRLNAAKNDKGSFQDAGFAKNFFIAPSLSYQATDKLSFSFDAEISSGKTTGNQIIFFPFGTKVSDLGVSSAEQVNIDYRKSYVDNDLYQKSRSSTFFGQANYKISDQWTSQTNFSASHSFSDGSGPYLYLYPNNVISRNDQATRNSKLDNIEAQQNFNGDFKIGSLRNRMVVGLDFTRINSQQYYYGITYDQISTIGTPSTYYNFTKANLDATYANPGPNSGYYPYPYAFRTNTYSAYVSDVLNLTDNLMASAGLRIDRFDHQTNNYKQTAYSPKFGLVYQPVKDVVSVFGNYQNGFVNQNGTNFSGSNFKPQQANQTEGGIKLNAFGGKLSSTISYYYI
ncbi:MAG: TonB-dependent receptor, partial [Sphingobacteriaceae bacterium]